MLLYLFTILLLVSNPSEKFKEELDGYLNSRLPGYERIDYNILQFPDDSKNVDLIDDGNLQLSGNMAFVPVKITDTYNRSRKAFITVRLKLFKKVLVVKNKIKPRENFSKDDFEIRVFDVGKIKGTPVEITDSISSYRSKVYLRPGEVLIREMTEDRPVILVGDPVTINAYSGNVIATVKGTAKQDGCPGDLISVATQNNKTFRAKVIDSHNVVIER